MMASADDSGTCGDNLTWTYAEATQKLTISGTGEMYHYSYNNNLWKSFRESIKEVEIGDGVTTIGENAFQGCIGLTSVMIPESVTSIGNYAFADCSGLTSITIPKSVTTITAEIETTIGKRGDVNGDGEVNVADHVKLTEIIMGQKE